jgi:hypothetical protein
MLGVPPPRLYNHNRVFGSEAALVVIRTDVLEERVASICRVRRIRELGMLAVAITLLADYFHPEDGDDALPRDVGSNKSHTAPHPRIWHSS